MNLVFGNILLMQIFKEIVENECVNERHHVVKDDNLIILRDNWKMVRGHIGCRPTLVLLTLK